MSLRHYVMVSMIGVLAACSPSSDHDSQAGPVATVKAAADSVKDATADIMPGASQITVSVTLDAKGLHVVDPDNHGASFLAFGTSRSVVDTAIAAALGPASAQDSNDECPAGPIAFSDYGPLSLNFQKGKFVGWGIFPSGDEEAGQFKTADGMHVGMARDALEEDHKLSFPAVSSLPEFSFGQIHGKFDSGTAPQTVAALWAGTNCIFR